MAKRKYARLEAVSLKRVTIDDPFLAPRQEVNRTVTLSEVYGQLRRTGQIDALRLSRQPGQPIPPHFFWDSDTAKWLEATGYSLAVHPDPELEGRVDEIIDMIERAQQEDGYLNSYFTVVNPQGRWVNLRDKHELYCAGHLMEAAVAYYEGTGKRKLLDVLCRYADYIAEVFGPAEGQKRGYPGHEEIELALVKLFHATGEERYFELAKFFIDERGRQPHYFDIEARLRGEDPDVDWDRGYTYNQSHLPVREQTTAEGHAVRAMYLFSAMADLVAETGDEAILAACRRLWHSVVRRRMYVTGGIGSASHLERFTYDYDLPNETAYTETCAAIGLVYWAHRMLQLEADGRYTDVMERALYNGVLSGVSLDGSRFFYANPLEADPERYEHRTDLFGQDRLSHVRQEWFGCACCPPNINRLMASLGQYAYSLGEGALYAHLYVGGQVEVSLDGKTVVLAQRTRYPWDGTVQLEVRPSDEMAFVLALRIPGWSRGATLLVNGQRFPLESTERNGYARIDRVWKSGDDVTLDLPMPVERIEAHPSVREDCGRIALQRGPIVYCLEEVDNGPNLRDITLPRDGELRAEYRSGLLGGVVAIVGEATRRDESSWEDVLYQPSPGAVRTVPFTAIPYYAWANREPGEMLVWIRESRD